MGPCTDPSIQDLSLNLKLTLRSPLLISEPFQFQVTVGKLLEV